MYFDPWGGVLLKDKLHSCESEVVLFILVLVFRSLCIASNIKMIAHLSTLLYLMLFGLCMSSSWVVHEQQQCKIQPYHISSFAESTVLTRLCHYSSITNAAHIVVQKLAYLQWPVIEICYSLKHMDAGAFCSTDEHWSISVRTNAVTRQCVTNALAFILYHSIPSTNWWCKSSGSHALGVLFQSWRWLHKICLKTSKIGFSIQNLV